MTNDLTMYRTLYRNFIDEAVACGLAWDAADFNARALVGVGPATRAAARAGDVDAIVYLNNKAEAWLNAQLDSEPDESEMYRKNLWNRACSHYLEREF